jgi:TfoX/Sxy family transcriptional regulator of competence genes
MDIRLPKDGREDFLKKYGATLFESHGAILKEYVTVPTNLLQNTEELREYLELSYAYVKTKTQKPSKEKKIESVSV